MATPDSSPAPAQPSLTSSHASSSSSPRGRIRQEHITVSAIGSAVLAAFVAFSQTRSVGDVAGKVEGHAHDMMIKLDEQTRAIATLQVTLVRLEARVEAEDKASERFSSELREALAAIGELGKAAARAESRLEEHDRRFQALEGRK